MSASRNALALTCCLVAAGCQITPKSNPNPAVMNLPGGPGDRPKQSKTKPPPDSPTASEADEPEHKRSDEGTVPTSWHEFIEGFPSKRPATTAPRISGGSSRGHAASAHQGVAGTRCHACIQRAADWEWLAIGRGQAGGECEWPHDKTIVFANIPGSCRADRCSGDSTSAYRNNPARTSGGRAHPVRGPGTDACPRPAQIRPTRNSTRRPPHYAACFCHRLATHARERSIPITRRIAPSSRHDRAELAGADDRAQRQFARRRPGEF